MLYFDPCTQFFHNRNNIDEPGTMNVPTQSFNDLPEDEGFFDFTQKDIDAEFQK